jgi:hypothetical protein
MNNFHNLTKKEQSSVTADELTAYEAYEMMSEGVPMLALEPPTEPVKPLVPMTKFYGVKFGPYGGSEMLFRTIEEAQACTELKPLKPERDYGCDLSYIGTQEKTSIETMEYATEAARDQLKEELTTYAAAKKRYDTDKAAYVKWVDTKSKILSGLRDAWYDAQRHAADMKRISDTFASYIKTATGNREIALNFLHKAYSVEQVAEATEWFDGDLAGGVFKIKTDEAP